MPLADCVFLIVLEELRRCRTPMVGCLGRRKPAQGVQKNQKPEIRTRALARNSLTRTVTRAPPIRAKVRVRSFGNDDSGLAA